MADARAPHSSYSIVYNSPSCAVFNVSYTSVAGYGLRGISDVCDHLHTRGILRTALLLS